ncbi:hypothetical protein C8J57DRAFT_1484881 [Mycena rebaudengoi]|nr:hypothetical protein C8J57DRAFT_1484881 [Mycena rebaudengoi]
MSSNKAQHPCILFPCPESKLKPQTTVSLKYILVLNVPSTYPYATLPGPVLARRRVRVPFLEFRGLSAAGRHRQPGRRVHRPYPRRTPAVLPLQDAVDRVARPQRHRPRRAPGLCQRQVGALLVVLARPGRGVVLPVDDPEAVRGSRGVVADGVLDDAAASEEGRALAAKVVGLYLAQEAQGPSASRTKRQWRVRSYLDVEDDEDDSADDDKPSEQPQRDPKAMQRLAQELASLTSECAQLVQRKRALQQQQLLATRSPMDKLRDEYQNYAAHASLADTEVTACLARAVFRLDEAQRRLRALRLARVGV